MSEEAWQMMWRRLVEVFMYTKSRKQARIFLEGVFTPTEKKMFSKRVMAAFLILSDWETRAIGESLKMSIATVYKLQQYLELNSDYRGFLEKLLPEKIPYRKERGIPKTPALVKIVDKIFQAKWERSKVLTG
jgi:Trp operon repressor